MQRSAGRIAAGYSAIARPRNAADRIGRIRSRHRRRRLKIQPARPNRSGATESAHPAPFLFPTAAARKVPRTARRHNRRFPRRHRIDRPTPLQPHAGMRPTAFAAPGPHVCRAALRFCTAHRLRLVLRQSRGAAETAAIRRDDMPLRLRHPRGRRAERGTKYRPEGRRRDGQAERRRRPSVPAPDGAKVSDRTCGRGAPATGGPGNACIPSKAPPRIKKARTRIRIRALHKITHKTPRGVVSIYFTSSNSTSSGCEPLPPSDAPPALACDCCPAFWAPAAPWACCWA